MLHTECQILQELIEIKKELQDIRSILEPKVITINLDNESKMLSHGETSINQIRNKLDLKPIENELLDKRFTTIE